MRLASKSENMMLFLLVAAIVSVASVRSQPGTSMNKDDLMSDINHLKQHMEEQGIKGDPSEMTYEESVFHFFMGHDTDNSTSLDGLELYKAIEHSSHQHYGANSEKKPTKEEQAKLDAETVAETDKRLTLLDRDHDGYISWPELYHQLKMDKAEAESKKM